MSKDVRAEIEKLREEIRRHNYLYYVLNRPEITDAEYDALFRRLQALEASCCPHAQSVQRVQRG